MKNLNKHIKKYKPPSAKFGGFHTTMTEDELTKEILGWFKKKPLFTNLTPIYRTTKVAPLFMKREECKKKGHKIESREPQYVETDGYIEFCLDCNQSIGFISNTKNGRLKSG